MRSLHISLLAGILALVAVDAYANGIDTQPGTSHLPFNIEASTTPVMDLTKSGLQVSVIATSGQACGTIPGTNPPENVAIGTLAQDGTGAYLSCQSQNGQGTAGTWQAAFGNTASPAMGWVAVSSSTCTDSTQYIPNGGNVCYSTQSPMDYCKAAGYNTFVGGCQATQNFVGPSQTNVQGTLIAWGPYQGARWQLACAFSVYQGQVSAQNLSILCSK